MLREFFKITSIYLIPSLILSYYTNEYRYELNMFLHRQKQFNMEILERSNKLFDKLSNKIDTQLNNINKPNDFDKKE